MTPPLTEQQLSSFRRCEKIMKTVNPYFANLLITIVKIDEKGNESVSPVCFSGFLFEYEKAIFWVSAGHIVSEVIQEACTEPNRIDLFRIIDAPIEGVPPKFSGIPCAEGEWHFMFANRHDLCDLTICLLSDRIVKLLESNGGNKFLSTSDIERNNHHAPLMYYMYGTPIEKQKEFVGPRIKVERNKYQESVEIATQPFCLPLKEVQDKKDTDETARNFWNAGNNHLYAQILEYSCGFEQPKSIMQMSGGPVFELNYSESDGYFVSLAGIQSGWLKMARIIKATKSAHLPQFIEVARMRMIEELKNPLNAAD
ncbi:hypothetical protein QQ056_01070 [Oscillatoria laete-virens NRMC-F 0139]|nr:hypothetical protein [Oscillatoria laete-virens]MDL5052162.1 hypothetical protein [Oscillatoria laete-virens NRMC-F 0139]